MPPECVKIIAVRSRRAPAGLRAEVSPKAFVAIVIKIHLFILGLLFSRRGSSFLSCHQNALKSLPSAPAGLPPNSRRAAGGGFLKGVCSNCHQDSFIYSRIALAEGFLSSFLAARLLQNFSRAVTGRQPPDNRRATGGQPVEVLQKYFH